MCIHVSLATGFGRCSLSDLERHCEAALEGIWLSKVDRHSRVEWSMDVLRRGREEGREGGREGGRGRREFITTDTHRATRSSLHPLTIPTPNPLTVSTPSQSISPPLQSPPPHNVHTLTLHTPHSLTILTLHLSVRSRPRL